VGIRDLGNNQYKKAAAKRFNDERQRKIDEAPQRAREREAEYNYPEAMAARKKSRMAMALLSPYISLIDLNR
jgi:hypothetical protein